MDFTRSFDTDALIAAYRLLPDKGVPCVYALKLRDGSLYIATTNHLQWRVYQIARGLAGAMDSTATALVRRRGVSHLDAYKVCRTEAGANALAETWTAAAKRRGHRIATEEAAAENKTAAATAMWTEDVAEATGAPRDPLADGDF